MCERQQATILSALMARGGSVFLEHFGGEPGACGGWIGKRHVKADCDYDWK
jgi:hypothetical protein